VRCSGRAVSITEKILGFLLNAGPGIQTIQSTAERPPAKFEPRSPDKIMEHPTSNLFGPEDVTADFLRIDVPRFDDKAWKATLKVTHKTEKKLERTLVFDLSLDDLKQWQRKIIEAIEACKARGRDRSTADHECASGRRI
jgi:hypothetical protein